MHYLNVYFTCEIWGNMLGEDCEFIVNKAKIIGWRAGAELQVELNSNGDSEADKMLYRLLYKTMLVTLYC